LTTDMPACSTLAVTDARASLAGLVDKQLKTVGYDRANRICASKPMP
jgi:hypothetical protein